ncbi:MAG TPA: hypothetical protein VIM19_17615 [Actinomycetes bacterium]
MTALLLAGAEETAGLSAYLERLVALDDRAAVRLQAGGTVLGVWGGPPMDVVTLRPVALAEQARVDVTVSAQRLLERLADDRPVELPAAVPGPGWAGLLPPRTGWTAVATVPAAVVDDAVRAGVEAFQRRVRLLSEAERTRARLDAVAEEVWGQPVLADVPLRAAHAADKVRLLHRDGEVTAYRAGGWLRLACPGGSVAVRPMATGLPLLPM